MNWNGYGTSQSWPHLKYYAGIYLVRLRRSAKSLSQDSQSPGRYLNPEVLEHET